LQKLNAKEGLKMKRILFLGAVALLLGVSTDALAQGYYNRGRTDNGTNRRRIWSGAHSGQLTRDEARQLRERQRALRQNRRGYYSDGTLSRDERRQIRRGDRSQDRLIRRYRNNRDRRYDYDNYGRSDNYYGRGTDRRRGNGYYRRGAGSPSHPVFGINGRRNRRY
jgi:hypothetical protein